MGEERRAAGGHIKNVQVLRSVTQPNSVKTATYSGNYTRSPL